MFDFLQWKLGLCLYLFKHHAKDFLFLVKTVTTRKKYLQLFHYGQDIYKISFLDYAFSISSKDYQSFLK